MNKRKQKGRAVNGILVLDKPAGLTSNAALQEVKRIFNAAKAGHTGSLDPLATGVLPLCLGEATKISQFLLDADKQYRVSIKLGIRTDTGDAEGLVVSEGDRSKVTTAVLRLALKDFLGEIEQLPPMYSALKYQGVPLYKLARQGVVVERELRRVVIHDIKLLEHRDDVVELQISCSKGTYIRTLADDLGEKLGCGAHVTVLRRTQSGAFTESDCVTLEYLRQVRETADEEDDYSGIDRLLVEMDLAVAGLPEVTLPESTARFIKQGQPVLVRHLPSGGLVRLYEGTRFIGIGDILDDGRVAPRRMIVE
ncbi:MAG: tRNA pseudouridine(55) synthase TruB [Pseudohongiellaceae bacterium]